MNRKKQLKFTYRLLARTAPAPNGVPSWWLDPKPVITRLSFSLSFFRTLALINPSGLRSQSRCVVSQRQSITTRFCCTACSSWNGLFSLNWLAMCITGCSWFRGFLFCCNPGRSCRAWERETRMLRVTIAGNCCTFVTSSVVGSLFSSLNAGFICKERGNRRKGLISVE